MPFPDLTKPDTGYQLYNPPGVDPRLVTRVVGVYGAKLDLDELVEIVRDAVVQKARQILQQDPDTIIPVIFVDFPVSLFIFRPLR